MKTIVLNVNDHSLNPPRLSTMRTTGGGYFFSGWQRLEYLKPPLSIEKQINLLQQRTMEA